MLDTLLKYADKANFREFVSRDFFKAMSTRNLVRQGRDLLDNYLDDEHFEEVCDRVAASLADSPVEIELDPGADRYKGAEDQDGFEVLKLYFHQLFECDETILDLRYEAFAPHDDTMRWIPRQYYVRWDDDFIEPLRDVYRAFYSHDDDLLADALDRLGLEGTSDLFLKHFRGQDEHALEFRREDFLEAFKDILHRCNERGHTLHPNFVALGVYLATLYEHLSELCDAYDVAAAYEAVVET